MVIKIAESNLTKRVLAQTLKELIKTQPFEKISVSDICNACGVSRKTFYYHFLDKYALVEWIFDNEFITMLRQSDIHELWSFIRALCDYFYREHSFYAQLLNFEGQNSFRQYFREFMFHTIEPFILPENAETIAIANKEGLVPNTAEDFYVRFLTDAILIAIFRWLTGGTKQTPEEFVTLLKSTADLITLRVINQSQK